MGDGMVVQVGRHEGTLFYSDEQQRNLRVLGVLTAAAYHDPETGGVNLTCRGDGYTQAALEALANYFIQNPGLKDVFDGFYTGRLRFAAMSAATKIGGLPGSLPKG